MDEVEACLTSLAISTDDERKAFGVSDLLEVDRVYAVNSNLDQATALVLGYKDQQEEEEEKRLNDLTIAALLEEDRQKRLEQDKRELEKYLYIPTDSTITRTKSGRISISSAKPIKDVMSSPMIEDVLNKTVTDKDDRAMVAELIQTIIVSGETIEIVNVTIDGASSFYKLKLDVKYHSTLSKHE